MAVYAQDVEEIDEIKQIDEIDLLETNINKNYNSIYEAIDNNDVEYVK